MKKMNRVIAVMIMTVTLAMPATASNDRNNDRNRNNYGVAANDRSKTHFDKVSEALNHTSYYKGHGYRPAMQTCTIKISRHSPYKRIVAKVERMKGVIDTYWNPDTRRLTVKYDAKVTTARLIKSAAK